MHFPEIPGCLSSHDRVIKSCIRRFLSGGDMFTFPTVADLPRMTEIVLSRGARPFTCMYVYHSLRGYSLHQSRREI